MTTQLISLSKIAESIATHHKMATEAALNAVEYACQAGELLNQAKEQVAHGEWLPWLREHCGLSERTARNYMRLSRLLKADPLKSARVADLPLRQALRELSETKVQPMTRDDMDRELLFNIEQDKDAGQAYVLAIIKLGEKLIETKVKVGHGNFIELFKKPLNLEGENTNSELVFGIAQAQKYMLIARKKYKVLSLCASGKMIDIVNIEAGTN